MPVLSVGLVTAGDADHAAEAIWLGAIAQLERAVARAREGAEVGRWSSYSRGEVNRLRRDVAQAMTIARVALDVATQAEGIEDDMQAALTSVARTRREGQKARDAAIRRNRKLRAAEPPSDAAATVRRVTR